VLGLKRPEERTKRDGERYPGFEIRTRLACQQPSNIFSPERRFLTRGTKEKNSNTTQNFVKKKNASQFIHKLHLVGLICFKAELM